MEQTCNKSETDQLVEIVKKTRQGIHQTKDSSILLTTEETMILNLEARTISVKRNQVLQ